MSRISIGLDVAPSDLSATLDKAVSSGFDFVTTPLFKRGPRGKTISEDPDVRETCSDQLLGTDKWSTCIVGKLSEWISLDDEDTTTRLDSESAFKQEVAFASHLAVPAVMTPSIKDTADVSNYAAILNQTVTSTQSVHFWVPIPTSYAAAETPAHRSGSGPSGAPATPETTATSIDRCSRKFNLEAATERDQGKINAMQRSMITIESPAQADAPAAAASISSSGGDPWHTWNSIRSLCEYSPQLSVALVLTDKLPVDGEAVVTAASSSSSASMDKDGDSDGDSDSEDDGAESDGEGEFSGCKKKRKPITSNPAHPSLSRPMLPSLELERWLGEPIKAVIVPTSLFTLPPAVGAGSAAPSSTASLLPQLPLLHQRFLLRLHEHKAQIVLQGPPDSRYLPPSFVPPAAGDGATVEYPPSSFRPYLLSLSNLLSTGGTTGERGSSLSSMTEEERERYHEGFDSYNDYLQAPLQPLMDNLESSTYETFERDPAKYNAYQRSIYLALCDYRRVFRAQGKREEDSSSVVVVMVVGAGRGPLVRRVLRASKQSGQRVRVYAVEKNPNAIMTLRHIQRSEKAWGELIDGPSSGSNVPRVTIVSSDMRTWQAPEKADILVSELLGSFGDNELSPECLDGAQRFLKHPQGVSIPCSYTSSLSPIMSSKLWNEAKAMKEEKWLETPFVSRIFNYCHIAPSQSPKDVFTFTHPNHSTAIDNRRYASIGFTAEVDAVVHGFAGYFDCVLYSQGTVQRLYGFEYVTSIADEKAEVAALAALGAGAGGDDDSDREGDEEEDDEGPILRPPFPRETVHCSIHPRNHTKDMQSWFPLYFPLKTPLSVLKGQVIDTRMWRCVTSSGGGRVFYEWSCSIMMQVPASGAGAGGSSSSSKATAAEGKTTMPLMIPLSTSGIHNPGGRSYYIGL
jgi:predicted RNA methylase